MGLHPWTDTASKCFIVGGGDAFLTNAPNSIHRTTLSSDAYIESKHVRFMAAPVDAPGQVPLQEVAALCDRPRFVLRKHHHWLPR